MSKLEDRLRNMSLTVCCEAADEIELLRGEVEGYGKEVDVLVDHVLELRRLLRKCRDYYVELGMSSVDTDLCDRINKELG